MGGEHNTYVNFPDVHNPLRLQLHQSSAVWPLEILLPSLDPTQKDEQLFWDLTPRDTNPIEAHQLNSDNTRALRLPNTEGGNKHLKARLAAAVQLTQSRGVEIRRLRSELNSRNLIGIPMQDSSAFPSMPQHKGCKWAHWALRAIGHIKAPTKGLQWPVHIWRCNFKVFSKSSSLLGAQAQALGDIIILRCLNLPEVDGMATVDVDTILIGVLALESHLDNYNLFQYLLSFPYLDSDVEITEYYTLSLPSLNRRLGKISNKFWDLTPRDTNPIEGSHAQDNQVINTNHSLTEAILLAHQFDSDNACAIKASVEFGIWENSNNSARARFSSQAACQARARAKNAETATAEGGSKGLKARLVAVEQLTHSKDVEIQCLRSQLNSRNLTVPIPTKDSDAGPSTPQCKGAFSPTFIDISHSPKSDIAPSSSSPIAGPSKLPDLLFSGLSGVQPLFLPDSDLDYVDALRSAHLIKQTFSLIKMGGERCADRMNNVFEEMGCYAVDGDDEVLASDPRPCSP
ncbi:hypothetical protein DFH07DRAFT_783165 [Mycena maculata]|uniref:Uncharacterized protein n=1 Tax=Mycena maculata TaxID=230809 RepID=A0AAD7HNS6_9AGAR|nr:hypothetical protein DFH07DRAFT_783165 [Mycena maculata]